MFPSATVSGLNVRRLAAIDLYGTRGTTRRRRLILAEFVVGVLALVGLGLWVLTSAADLGGRALGLWCIGAGLNYAPLTVYAVSLSRPGALEAELAGVDPGQELRRYGVLQAWLLVPLALLVFTVRISAMSNGHPISAFVFARDAHTARNALAGSAKR